jgi:hypothetical protein
MEITKVGLLLIKAESTYGVDSVPDATNNVIAAMRGEVTLDDLGNPIVRQILDGGFNEVAGIKTELAWGWKFKTELRGNRTTGIVPDISVGSAANKLEIDALLQACDLMPTYIAESSGGAHDGLACIYKPTIPSGQGSKRDGLVSIHKASFTKCAEAKATLRHRVSRVGQVWLCRMGHQRELSSPPADSAIPGVADFPQARCRRCSRTRRPGLGPGRDRHVRDARQS